MYMKTPCLTILSGCGFLIRNKNETTIPTKFDSTWHSEIKMKYTSLRTTADAN